MPSEIIQRSWVVVLLLVKYFIINILFGYLLLLLLVTRQILYQMQKGFEICFKKIMVFKNLLKNLGIKILLLFQILKVIFKQVK